MNYVMAFIHFEKNNSLAVNLKIIFAYFLKNILTYFLLILKYKIDLEIPELI